MSMSAEGMMITLPAEAWQELCANVAEIRARLDRQMPAHPMSPAEVAKVVGKSEKTVRRWIGARKLRARHEGRTTLVRPVDLQRFLDTTGGAA